MAIVSTSITYSLEGFIDGLVDHVYGRDPVLRVCYHFEAMQILVMKWKIETIIFILGWRTKNLECHASLFGLYPH